MHKAFIFLIVIMLLPLTSCKLGGGEDSTATPTGTASQRPTKTFTSTWTLSPTSTKTQTPTSTPTLTSSPTQTPTNTLVPYIPPTKTYTPTQPKETGDPVPTDVQELCWDGSVPINGQCPPVDD